MQKAYRQKITLGIIYLKHNKLSLTIYKKNMRHVIIRALCIQV